MTRWLFWTLVLVNLGVVLWVTGIRQPVDPARLPRPAVNDDRMMLLADPGAAQSAQDCYTLGPFATPERAVQAESAVNGLGFEVSRRSQPEQQVEGYRVLLGPYQDAARAEAMHKDLSEKGVRDHYIIRSGLSNAIALGFFSELAKAEQFLGELKRKGVSAEIRVRQQEGPPLWWLDLEHYLDAAAAAALQARDWDDGVALVQRPCGQPSGLPSVAPVQ